DAAGEREAALVVAGDEPRAESVPGDVGDGYASSASLTGWATSTGPKVSSKWMRRRAGRRRGWWDGCTGRSRCRLQGPWPHRSPLPGLPGLPGLARATAPIANCSRTQTTQGVHHDERQT